MTDLNIGLQGSFSILLIFIVLVLVISFYYYKRTIPDVSATKKTILRILRFLSLTFLFLILFEPVIYTTYNDIIPPKPIVIIDNSASINLEDNNSKKIIDFISNNSFDSDNIYYFDDNTYTAKDKKYEFEGQYTDISSAFEKVKDIEADQNISSIVLVTDGSFNKGINPEYAIENLNIPVVSIGVGEKSYFKDIIAKSMLSNDIAYINNDIPLLAKYSSSGIDTDSLSVSLLVNNKIEQTKSVLNPSDVSDAYVEFIYRDSIPGRKKITFIIDSVAGESNTQNNTYSDYIQLLDNKKRVGIFASSPNPDVSFLHQFLVSTKQYDVESYIKKDASSWYNKPTKTKLSKIDIFVLVDFPSNVIENDVIDNISSELSKDKSVLFIAGKHVSKSKMQKLEKHLPFTMVSDSRNEFFASVLFSEDAISNSIFKTQSIDQATFLDDLPPLFKTESFYKAKPDASVYSTFAVNNMEIEEPTIMSKSTGLSRSWAFLSYGLYRWKMINAGLSLNEEEDTQYSFYNSMFDNVFKWLSITDRKQKFIFETDKNIYQSNENISFSAQLYDDKYDPIDDYLVKATIKSANFEKEVILKNITNGRYIAEVAGIPTGDFSIEARALTPKEELYASHNTSFTVESMQVENRHYGLKEELLKNISSSTGGKYLHIDNSDSLSEILSNELKGADKQISITDEINIWNSTYLMIIVILLLSVEWFLRKRFGML